jgi:murein DD-endopeptidase MepM/ murein hydrolase activator NlpD
VMTLAVVLFLLGLLLGVRVMFFGVRRQVGENQLHHRRWPLALAAFLAVSGALLYARADGPVTASWLGVVVLGGITAGAAAWLLVQKSAAIPSTDPEDDPRYRFQGHVARVITAIAGAGQSGRIAFDFDGRRHEFGARWSPEADLGDGTLAAAPVGTEVVIEFIDGDVAFVEPWAVVEKRL